MTYHLVVLKPFDGFKRGDIITDSVAIARITNGPQANFVVRVNSRES